MFDTFDIRWVFGAFALAAGIFAFYTYYHKSVLGKFVRALLASGAFNPESAKTFAELDIAPTAAYEHALLGGSLSRIVTVLGERPHPRRRGSALPNPEDLAVLRFYIPAEKEAKARGIYSDDQSIVAPVVVTATALVLAVLVCVLVAAFPNLFVQ